MSYCRLPEFMHRRLRVRPSAALVKNEVAYFTVLRRKGIVDDNFVVTNVVTCALRKLSGSFASVLKHTLLLKTRRTFPAGSFAAFRKSSAPPRVSDVLSAKASNRRSSRSLVRAQQQQQVPSDTEPGWDKLSSDDFDTWMDNGGPSTPLLVRP